MNSYQSIYSDRRLPVGMGKRDLVAALDVELRMCDQLMVMGYVYCNGLKLEDQSKRLSEQIKQLEDDIKLGIL